METAPVAAGKATTQPTPTPQFQSKYTVAVVVMKAHVRWLAYTMAWLSTRFWRSGPSSGGFFLGRQ